ncbi:hypothetical protein [Thiocapsa bogorovii]|uniref:hypothetical protein n=1 Tax=Thiocapsa bogorovii TaxID=521689 RepID=UPI001E356DD8|nr:hypothetical protein [Thiocapsa bogorovii]UHD17123.1 hypothetical protein LT988_03435 [Thiocapsa bogorovii]
MHSPLKFVGVTFVLAAIAATSAIVALGLEPFVAKMSAPVIGAAALGALVASVLFLHPIALLWIVTILTLVVVGLAKYFIAGVGGVQWISYGLGALLYLPALAVLAGGQARFQQRSASTWVLFWLTVFLLTVVVSWSFYPPSPGLLLASIKTWAFFGGVWVFLAVYPIPLASLKAWFYGWLGIAFLQPLLVLYQWFVVGGRQKAATGMFSGDSVTGTFGGGVGQGGLAPVLALFLVLIALMLLSAWRQSLINAKRLSLLLMIVLLPLVFMEEKIVFLYVPLGALVLFRDYAYRRPLAFALTVGVVAIALSGLLAVYQAIHWDDRGKDATHMFAYSFQVESEHDESTGHLTRPGAVVYWARQNFDAGLGEMLFGHGLGSAKTGGQATGWVAKQEDPMFIDRTGLALLLWEVGLIGAVTFFGLLLSASLMASRLMANETFGGFERALAQALVPSFPLFGVAVLYRSDVPYAGNMMFLLMSTFGLLFWLQHRTTIGSKVTE